MSENRRGNQIYITGWPRLKIQKEGEGGNIDEIGNSFRSSSFFLFFSFLFGGARI